MGTLKYEIKKKKIVMKKNYQSQLNINSSL